MQLIISKLILEHIKPAIDLFNNGFCLSFNNDCQRLLLTPLLNSLLSNEGVETMQFTPPFSQSIITALPLIPLKLLNAYSEPQKLG